MDPLEKRYNGVVQGGVGRGHVDHLRQENQVIVSCYQLEQLEQLELARLQNCRPSGFLPKLQALLCRCHCVASYSQQISSIN